MKQILLFILLFIATKINYSEPVSDFSFFRERLLYEQKYKLGEKEAEVETEWRAAEKEEVVGVVCGCSAKARYYELDRN
jgi:hypothetical protein